MSVPKPFVGGNWKCFNDVAKVTKLITDLESTAYPSKDSVDVLIAPTYLHLMNVNTKLGSKFTVSAQDVSQFTEGAFTGSISASGLQSIGIQWTLVGHSERRTCFKEDDLIQYEKTKKALEHGLNIVFCIGETLSERQSNETFHILNKQLDIIKDLLIQFPQRFVIAYEPVWSIGTGVIPTQEQITEAHLKLREYLVQICADAGNDIRILYGGSVKPDNAHTIYAIPHVNGFLVGGASLDAVGFSKIVEATVVVERNDARL